MGTAAAIIFAFFAVAVSGAVLAARLASRPPKGRHQAAAAAPAVPPGTIGGHLGQAGCMPLYDSELLRARTPAPDWDLTTQLPRLGRQPWDTASFPATPPEVTP